ncbi:MAG: hypothetical protein ACXVCH_17735, partial [Bdellovibrionota bacterium]
RTQVNFRKDDFAKSSRSREMNLATLRRPLMAFGAVMASLFISLIVESSVYKSRLAETNVALEKAVRGFFGQLSGSAVKTYMSNTSTLKASIKKELDKERDLAKLLGPNPHSPVDFLKELSASVPKDVVVDMIQYQVGSSASAPFSATDDSTASLTFLVTNPQMAEKLAGAVGGKLSGVQRGKMEEVPGVEGTPPKWKITFTGKPTGDSYGK